MPTTSHKQILNDTDMPLRLHALVCQDHSIDNGMEVARPAIHPGDLRRNNILASLSESEIDFLLPHLEMCDLPFNRSLYQYGDTLSHVYFPTTAIVSMIYVLADGGMTEISVVGHEGLLGVSVLTGENALGTAVVRSAGEAYKVKASVLQELYLRGGSLPQLLLRYSQLLFVQATQNSVSARHYSIDQQLSRWLLEHLDRLPGNVLKVTQEFIANMLGVRRESVTEASGKLQSEGLIQNKRGNIIVLDREGLETYAGECYNVAKREMDQMLSLAQYRGAALATVQVSI